MCSCYDLWPQFAKEVFDSQLESFDISHYESLIFAGMGGSGTIGDMFSAIFSKTNIPTYVVKGYNLPKKANKKSLIICTSVSGNTVETLNVLKKSIELGLETISFTSGGKMEELCKKNNLEYRIIKKIHSPRATLPTFLYSLLKIFLNSIPITKNEILESIQKLNQIQKNINSKNLTMDNQSILIASWMNKIPIIYYPWGLESAAIRFKNSLQENSKIQVFAEDIIEASHNGIVPWKFDTEFFPFLIQGNDDFVKTKERWKVCKKFFLQNQIDFKEIHSGDGNILTKIIVLTYILDYASIYKAIMEKIDPSPVLPIEFIKKHL